MGKAEISLGALYSQLLAVEAHLDLQQMQHQSSMNSLSHGRSGFRGRGGGGRGGFGHDDTGSSLGTKPVCQLCRKTGHTMIRCWKRFDMNFSRENKMANNAEGPGCNVDTSWYADTGATNHITSELDKLAIHEKYTCHEQIHAANGGGMHITHVGHSTLHTPTRILSLKNVLRVPNSKKNLLQFIVSLVITMSLLNIIHISFWLRIPTRGKFFCVADVREDFIPFPPWRSLPPSVP
jgi:hypothetical protein